MKHSVPLNDEPEVNRVWVPGCHEEVRNVLRLNPPVPPRRRSITLKRLTRGREHLADRRGVCISERYISPQIKPLYECLCLLVGVELRNDLDAVTRLRPL